MNASGALPSSSPPHRSHPKLRLTLTIVALIIALPGIALWMLGSHLAAPNPAIVGSRPTPIGTQQFETQMLRIARPDGPTVAGWFIPGTQADGAVLLLHGIHADRRQMLGRAGFLHAAGYSVLLIDLQAHGETPGEHIGFGLPESGDVRAALGWLRERLPNQPIGVIGVSLGGAAAILGEPAADADALVLESVYSSIERAVENRLAIRLGKAGRHLAPLLLWQIEARLNIPLAKLQPLQAITRLRSPLLLIAGSEDRHTVAAESQALFDQAPAPKSLWMVDGAGHQDLHRYAPQRYQTTVLEFLQRYLRD